MEKHHKKSGLQYRHYIEKPAEKAVSSLKRLSLVCWKEMDLCGDVRFVLRRDRGGKLYVLDTISNPSLAEKAAFLNTARLNNWAPADVLSAIVEGTIARHEARL